MIRSGINQEDEEFFTEHIENMKRNKRKSINNIENENENEEKTVNVFYNYQEILNPPTYTNFTEIDLHKNLQKNLQKMQFDKMTPIQKAAIGYLMNGKDVMGCAQTGSGKTVAFLLPIINSMLNEGPPEGKINFKLVTHKSGYSAPVALILVPTRELADQIFKQARKLISQTGISVTKVYGGVPHDSQIRFFSVLY